MLKSARWPLDTVTLLKGDLLQNKYTLKIFSWASARNRGQHRQVRVHGRTLVGLADSYASKHRNIKYKEVEESHKYFVWKSVWKEGGEET